MVDLRALLLADTALPIGLHAQSFGLEAALLQGSGRADIGEQIEGLLSEPDTVIDAPAVALTYRSSDPMAVDAEVTAARLAPDLARASQRSGRRLAQLAPGLRDTQFCHRVRARASDGNLGVVQGSITDALGIPVEESVVIAVNRIASALVFAAVRLGRVTALTGQAILTRLEPTILAIAEEALTGELPPAANGDRRHGPERPPTDPVLFQT